jgi:putative endonuclease
MPQNRTDDTAWYVYVVRCADNSLYTGIARSLQKRLQEHNACDRYGAKYTRSRRPVRLVYYEVFESRSQAARREAAIKNLSKKRKEALVFSRKSTKSIIPNS